MHSPLTGHVVAVSPHIDDAVFSLGATLARASRSGARVEILTIFGLDPASSAPANGWDSRGGFTTEGEAALARRNEDSRACGVLGAQPTWLTFRGGGYTTEKPTDEIWAAVADVVDGANVVLVPGSPLTNPDHAWLSELLTGRALPCGRLGMYAEQPYRYMSRKSSGTFDLPAVLKPNGPVEVDWVRVRPGVDGYRLKRRAIRAYATQLALLGFSKPWKLDRLLLHEALHGGEAFAWHSHKDVAPSGS